jgi:hypothetical protein
MKSRKNEALCPVCKRTSNVTCVWVPGGHGRFCEYICINCYVAFQWGSNKFGDCYDTNDIPKVVKISLSVEALPAFDPKTHSQFRTDEVAEAEEKRTVYLD